MKIEFVNSSLVLYEQTGFCEFSLVDSSNAASKVACFDVLVVELNEYEL